MKEFDTIYLSWRKGLGDRRYLVGQLSRTASNAFEFRYDPMVVEKASKDGFTCYTEFPEIDKVYTDNVLEVFAQRLTKAERPDIQEFYSFWDIAPQHEQDRFYLLGHTQGLLPTDNFEFLADYKPVPDLKFMTELAGLSKYQLPNDALKAGDILRYELEPQNQFDQEAVKIFRDQLEVGYIKKVHCRVFHKVDAESLSLSVKAVDKNGLLKKAFIRVSL